ncbi:hypothetical protein T10_11771 [Trichinella papuae]|uniref:Uncharacterized protein n=1 Tax=Trichinella papuae TaxID=268474 RepID=A0A0V1MQQ3_9BILA|nr:hypothetical protein T10_11771 [Trichinella papuae]
MKPVVGLVWFGCKLVGGVSRHLLLSASKAKLESLHDQKWKRLLITFRPEQIGNLVENIFINSVFQNDESNEFYFTSIK